MLPFTVHLWKFNCVFLIADNVKKGASKMTEQKTISSNQFYLSRCAKRILPLEVQWLIDTGEFPYQNCVL